MGNKDLGGQELSHIVVASSGHTAPLLLQKQTDKTGETPVAFLPPQPEMAQMVSAHISLARTSPLDPTHLRRNWKGLLVVNTCDVSHTLDGGLNVARASELIALYCIFFPLLI